VLLTVGIVTWLEVLGDMSAEAANYSALVVVKSGLFVGYFGLFVVAVHGSWLVAERKLKLCVDVSSFVDWQNLAHSFRTIVSENACFSLELIRRLLNLAN